MTTRTRSAQPLTISTRTPLSPGDNQGAASQSYAVRRGDMLTHIAKRNGLSLNALVRANPQIANPNRIFPGQMINIPGGALRRANSVVRPTNDNRAGRPLIPTPNSLSHAPTLIPTLRRGAQNPFVGSIQARLQNLGFNPGSVDSEFGPKTHNAVRRFQISQGLTDDGIVGPETLRALQQPSAIESTRASNTTAPAPLRVTNAGGENVPRLRTYPPFSQEAKALFRQAAQVARVPQSWANSNGLHQILNKESRGRVGVPNYTYGRRARNPAQWPQIWNELKQGRITARSSATGLGQLLLNNVERYYPSGRAGIGNPVEEAAGMLKYIKSRYGTPENAWRLYGTRHEGY